MTRLFYYDKVQNIWCSHCDICFKKLKYGDKMFELELDDYEVSLCESCMSSLFTQYVNIINKDKE